MKVRATTPFFDDNGLHKKGDIVEVKEVYPDRMELIEETKTEKKETKTSKTKKG